MKNTQILFALLALFISSCTSTSKPLAIEPGVAKSMAEYRKANISNLTYHLNFNIPEAREDAILGVNKISFDLLSTDQDLQIDFRENSNLLHQIVCNNKSSHYRFEAEHLIIPKEELIIGNNQIEIDFTAGTSSLNRNDDFLYTLFVPDRARTAFPCFD